MEKVMVGNITAEDLKDRLGFHSVTVDITADDAMLSIPLTKEGMNFFEQDSTMASAVKTYRISLEGLTKAGQQEGVLQLTCLFKVNDKDNVSDEEVNATYSMVQPDLAALLLSTDNPLIVAEVGLTTENEDWIKGNGELLSNVVVFLTNCLKNYLRVTGQGTVKTTFVFHTGFNGFDDVMRDEGYTIVRITKGGEEDGFICWVDKLTEGTSRFTQVTRNEGTDTEGTEDNSHLSDIIRMTEPESYRIVDTDPDDFELDK